MNIESFHLYQYKLPLVKPISVGEKTIHEREGLVVLLKSKEGAEGFGEIAPLPGRSRETLADCVDQLEKLKVVLEHIELPKNLARLEGGFHKWLEKLYLKPSVRYGIEMAILTLLSDTKKLPFLNLISSECHVKIKINGLIHSSSDKIEDKIADALALVAQGFSAVKLKVGKDIQKEIKTVQKINEALNGRALLHIDCNQQWTLNEAIEFGNEVGCAAVEYIEEPFQDLKDIPDFFMQTTIPVALDESLVKQGLDKVKSIDGVDFFILKPTLLGGIEKTWNIMKEAKRLAISSVVSSSFESDIGLCGLANLAGATLRDYPAGLDTGKYFKQNLFKEPLKIDHGKMDISKGRFHSDDINLDLLTKIEL